MLKKCVMAIVLMCVPLGAQGQQFPGWIKYRPVVCQAESQLGCSQLVEAQSLEPEVLVQGWKSRFPRLRMPRFTVEQMAQLSTAQQKLGQQAAAERAKGWALVMYRADEGGTMVAVHFMLEKPEDWWLSIASVTALDD